MALLTDAVEDGGETLVLRLTNPSGATIGTAEAVGTIANVAPPAGTADTFTASFEQMPSEHDGSGTFTFHARFSAAPGVSFQTIRDEWFAVTGGTVLKAKRVDGSNMLREVHVQPASNGDVTLTLEGGRACTTTGAICTGDGRKLANTVTATVQGPPGLSVADARVEEGANVTLDFAVSLSRAASGTVTVDYATSDGTATAGNDYTATSGTLTFAAGETMKTVSVPVLDDAHDEGEENLTLTLSDPTGGAYLEDATATGVIENSDPMPQAWIARFGRTVTGHVLDAVSDRIAASREAGLRVSVGGRQLSFAEAARDEGQGAAGLAGDRDGEARLAALGAWLRGEDGGEAHGETRALTGRDLLLGSSFSLTEGTDESGHAAIWGRMAVSAFDGREDGVTLDGDVTTALLGADFARERWTAGLVLSRSAGNGSYRGPTSGAVSSTLTALHPWGSLRASERLSLWAAAGWGEGELELAPAGEDPMKADLSYAMTAAGFVSELLAPGREDGARLALKGDARLTRTSTDAGDMPSAAADVWLIRAGLEGSRRFALEGASLVPSVELALRRDGGDAETGFGADLGGGVSLNDPALGLTMDLSARGLLTHEASGFREWGASASFGFDPDPSPLGLKASLRQDWGAASKGGADTLLHRPTLAGLEDEPGAFDADSRLEAELGYGFAVFGGRAVATPHAGWSGSGGDGTFRLGQRLNVGAAEWKLESAFGGTGRSVTAGYAWRLGSAVEFGLDLTRSEPANDNRAQHEVALRLTMRW